MMGLMFLTRLQAQESHSQWALVSLQLYQGRIISGSGFSPLRKSFLHALRQNQEIERKNLLPIVMNDQSLHHVLIPLIEDHLNSELEYAKAAYYSFDFSRVNEVLVGRLDPQACLWRALAAFSNHQMDLARKEVLSFLMVDSQEKLSSKDFSPKFLEFIENIRKSVSPKPVFVDLFRDGFSESEKTAWRLRWKDILERAHLEGVVVVNLETIGWNQKLRFQSWGRHSPYLYEKNIEFVGSPNWKEAGKILVNTVFSVDTLSSEK